MTTPSAKNQPPVAGERSNSIILPRNTPIPCKSSDVFFTIVDQQKSILLEVTEGEDTDPSFIKIVGSAEIHLLPYPKHAPMEVLFEYDLDGIIHITVVDQITNFQLGELSIRRASNLDEHEVQALQRKISKFTMSPNPVSVFISYAHKDTPWLRKLETHLGLLKQQGLISTWYDRRIMPGTDCAKVIGQQLEQATIILLLVSVDFLASNYCDQSEIKRALERHQAGEA
jgi:TIR domain-containing protein/Hsp70 protein